MLVCNVLTTLPTAFTPSQGQREATYLDIISLVKNKIWAWKLAIDLGHETGMAVGATLFPSDVKSFADLTPVASLRLMA